MGYAVKELFFTLQGEGAQAGRAAVFCRFTGCNLWTGREEDRHKASCTFCDTDFIGTAGPGGGRCTPWSKTESNTAFLRAVLVGAFCWKMLMPAERLRIAPLGGCTETDVGVDIPVLRTGNLCLLRNRD